MSHARPHTFVAIYEGETISAARVVAASSDPRLVKFVEQRLLPQRHPKPHCERHRSFAHGSLRLDLRRRDR